MPASKRDEWPDDKVAQLRTLWGDGFSAAEIGRRIGCTACAVVGKRKRLGLSGRPSPIKPKGSGTPRPIRRVGPSTLPPLPSLNDA